MVSQGNTVESAEIKWFKAGGDWFKAGGDWLKAVYYDLKPPFEIL